MNASRLLSLACAAAVTAVLQAGVARAEIKTQWVEYKRGDTPLRGYLAYDDAVTGKRPGVLLAHSRSGMSETTLKDAVMIAKLGYVALAEDIFGKDVLPKTVPEMQAQTVIYNMDRPLMRARATAGFDVLKANPMVDTAKIAVIGYCFGGTVGVELAETGVRLSNDPVFRTASVYRRNSASDSKDLLDRLVESLTDDEAKRLKTLLRHRADRRR